MRPRPPIPGAGRQSWPSLARCCPAIRSSHSFDGTLLPRLRACHELGAVVASVIGGSDDKREFFQRAPPFGNAFKAGIMAVDVAANT